MKGLGFGAIPRVQLLPSSLITNFYYSHFLTFRHFFYIIVEIKVVFFNSQSQSLRTIVLDVIVGTSTRDSHLSPLWEYASPEWIGTEGDNGTIHLN